MTTLAAEQIVRCRQAFDKFDRDGSGSIDFRELQELLSTLGHPASEEEVFNMIREVDGNGSGDIEFPEFLKIVEAQMNAAKRVQQDQETLDAFVAMGGNPDKSGFVSAEKLVQTIKDFELTIDIEQLIAEADTDHSGCIEFDEFHAMLNE